MNLCNMSHQFSGKTLFLLHILSPFVYDYSFQVFLVYSILKTLGFKDTALIAVYGCVNGPGRVNYIKIFKEECITL